jgi:dUTP pyrophosphatase
LNNRKFEKVSLQEWMKAKLAWFTIEDWELYYDQIKLPKRATHGSSGYDMYIPFDLALERWHGETIPTGIKVNMNINNELLIFPRSGLGFKHYTRLANTIGKVDSDYYNNPTNEGHIFVKIRAEHDEQKLINLKQGESFCQCTFYEYLTTVDDHEYEKKDRDGGMGSTSK